MERCNKLITEEVAVLTQLREIRLWNLKNVRHVWSKCPRVLPRGSLQNLFWISLYKCYNLIYVFTPSIAKALVGLESLEIHNCKDLEAIVAEEEDDKMEGTLILFPQLKVVSLEKLPKLKMITPEPTYRINFSSCTSLRLRGCDSTTVEQVPKLITEEVAVLTQLREILLWNLKNVRHVWSKCPRVLPRGSLQNLRSLQIWDCDNLRYVFTPSIAEALVGLGTIEIHNCMELEAIVAEEEEDDKMERSGDTLILFPQLETLSLKELPKLQQITPEPTYCINVSSCKKLELEGCGRLNKTLMSDTILEKIRALKETR